MKGFNVSARVITVFLLIRDRLEYNEPRQGVHVVVHAGGGGVLFFFFDGSCSFKCFIQQLASLCAFLSHRLHVFDVSPPFCRLFFMFSFL